MSAADRFWLLSLAILLDAAIGDPAALWRRIPHPVVLMGRLIEFLERAWNKADETPGRRRAAGVLAVAAVTGVAALAAAFVERALAAIPFGWFGIALLAAVLLAGRSLFDHVLAVASAHADGGLPAARSAVARIVGRDPDALDEPGVSRAAIESAAENFSDGLVAPALWFLLLGLPGIAAYKAINTADSMIGHRSERYRAFGWAAARLDDLVNWPAARLAGLLIALAAPLAGGSTARAVATMKADAARHRSPNAGWPEAAMAGALGIALAGPRRYSGHVVDDPFLNAGGRAAAASDIRRALRVYAGACGLLLLVTSVTAIALALGH